MCIDSQMLSAYLDGELLEPYRTQVEEHLAHCPACRKHLEDLKAVSDRMHDLDYPEDMLLRNKDRIYSLLEKKYLNEGKVSFFRRRVQISLPSMVTAAAAVVFIFIGGFMFFGSKQSQTEDILPSFAVQADSSNVHYVSGPAYDSLENYTLEEILQYLDSKGYQVDISIKGLKPLEEK